MAALSEVIALDAAHDCGAFDCGQPPLTAWLQRHALANQRADAARTYVVHRDGVVIGYYAIATGSAQHDEVPTRIARGLARHPIPVMLLARLAVDRREHGAGLGGALLKDALARIARLADEIGARAVLVHPIDAAADRFYSHFGFEPSPLQPRQMFLLMKDLRASLPAERTAPRG